MKRLRTSVVGNGRHRSGRMPYRTSESSIRRHNQRSSIRTESSFGSMSRKSKICRSNIFMNRRSNNEKTLDTQNQSLHMMKRESVQSLDSSNEKRIFLSGGTSFFYDLIEDGYLLYVFGMHDTSSRIRHRNNT